jgi:hypothetical protein
LKVEERKKVFGKAKMLAGYLKKSENFQKVP